MTTAQQDMVAIRKEVDQTNRGFVEAMNRGDVEGATRETYTRDATVIPPGAPTVKGRENIAPFWTAAGEQIGLQAVDLTTLELEMLGDGLYEVGRATLTLADGQLAAASYVVIWKREDGRWRWHVDIWNMNAS